MFKQQLHHGTHLKRVKTKKLTLGAGTYLRPMFSFVKLIGRKPWLSAD